MYDYESQYLSLLEDVLKAPIRGDRTGTGTHSVFGRQLRIDLGEAFPLLTTKKVYFKAIFHELKWMLMGQTNIKYLNENKVYIWNDWPLKKYQQNYDMLRTVPPISKSGSQKISKEDFIDAILNIPDFAERHGDCGPVYGYQWRKWWNPAGGTDQIRQVIDTLLTKPEDRRMIVSAWNVNDIPDMTPSGLPPCHLLMQFYTRLAESGARFLDCMVIIRSNDLFLGAPFNMAQYALLTHLMAKTVGMLPGELIYTIGDAHIYLNHVEQVKEQLKRDQRPGPTLYIKAEHNDPADYEWQDLEIINYNPHEAIKADIAV